MRIQDAADLLCETNSIIWIGRTISVGMPRVKVERQLMGCTVIQKTLEVIADIRASSAQVYYRIGRSFGANVNPPDDFDKFASDTVR